jgi:hypothetical protein
MCRRNDIAPGRDLQARVADGGHEKTAGGYSVQKIGNDCGRRIAIFFFKLKRVLVAKGRLSGTLQASRGLFLPSFSAVISHKGGAFHRFPSWRALTVRGNRAQLVANVKA